MRREVGGAIGRRESTYTTVSVIPSINKSENVVVASARISIAGEYTGKLGRSGAPERDELPRQAEVDKPKANRKDNVAVQRKQCHRQ
jgi:hypothetical protein